MQSETIKRAHSERPIHELIATRWSARAFSHREVDSETLETLLEAASWAASANNEQPWMFITARRGSQGFQTIWESLNAGNQPWTQHAAAFVVAIARTTFAATGKPNPFAEYDLGMATAQLLLQATSLDLHGHPMAGFDRAKLIETLAIPENQKPMTILALGYLDEAETLEEPYRTRELTPRSRKPLSEIVRAL